MIDIKENYFMVDGIKYVIIYQDAKMDIFKSIDNSLVPLSDIEKVSINQLLRSNKGYKYDSERLLEVVKSNAKLERVDYIYKYLELLEENIPEECRDNLYRNLETLEIYYNLDALGEDSKDSFTNSRRGGGYDCQTNIIDIDLEDVKQLWAIAEKTSNPQEFFMNQYSHTLFHELAHMASTDYDSDTEVALCGFDMFPEEEVNQSNRGLTEGLTEILATKVVPIDEDLEYASGCYIETCLVNQLALIVGDEVLIKSYFANHGIDLIAKKLGELEYPEYKSYELFRNIENNYYLRAGNYKNSLLASVQNSLLDCLEAKCNSLLSNQDNLNDILSKYEKMLVTPEVIEKVKKDPDSYDGLVENIEKFKEIKNKYFTLDTNNLEGDKYLECRNRAKDYYLQEKSGENVTHSSFIVSKDEKVCDFRLENVNETGIDLLYQDSFQYNDEFRKKLLEPALIDYAQCGPVMNLLVGSNQNNSNITLVSENNNVLSVSNIDTVYANNLVNSVKKVDANLFKQKQQLAQSLEKSDSKQLVKTEGFSNILILSLVAGVVSIILIVLGIIISL